MIQTSKISIIVPVYNVAPYLRQCMDSVINQTYRNIEIICIDDGSTDGSEKIIDEYAKIDSRIKVLHTINSGVSSARNTAISQASGEYLLFVDGDDWIDTSTCEKTLSQMINKSADLVMWPYVREFPDHSSTKEIFFGEQIFDEVGCRKLQRRMVGLCGEELVHPENADALSTVWGKLYRRSIIENNHIEFADLTRIGTYEDGLFNMYYLAYTKRAAYIADFFSHYRKNFGMTSKHRSDLPVQWKNLFEDMRRYIESNGPESDFVDALNNRISLSIIGLGLNALSGEKALTEIRSVLSDECYRNAIKNLPMRYFPLHWWVFFACCKLNFSWGVLLLLKCMKRMKG